jgi:hypothetical protein
MLLWFCKVLITLCVWADWADSSERRLTIATSIGILFPQEYQSSPEERLKILEQQSKDLKEIEQEWRAKWRKTKTK